LQETADGAMDRLKLVALDEEDLTILSAHVQDAVLKLGDMKFMRAARSFVVPMNRFAWERRAGAFAGPPERRNSVLHFGRVTRAASSGLSAAKPSDVLSLLALRFHPGEAPAGAVELVFSGGAAVRLEVECIEAQLADLGGAWEASSRPRHGI